MKWAVVCCGEPTGMIIGRVCVFVFSHERNRGCIMHRALDLPDEIR